MRFRRLLEALAEHQVAHVVIGGVAVTLQGSGYVTEDLDISYERTRENVERLGAALRPYHPRLRVARESGALPFLFDVKTVLKGCNFTLTTDLGDIDLLGSVSGLGNYEDVLEHAEPLFVIDSVVPTQVLSLRGLILAKRAANRPKDQLVLPELEALLEVRDLDQSSPDESNP